MWRERIEIIAKIIALRFTEIGEKYTHARAAAYLGLAASTYQRLREGQSPSADDLQKISLRLGLNPEWALYGTGDPLAPAEAGRFNPEHVRICDTLHEVALGHYADRLEEFALVGGITPQQLTACISSQMLPPATAVARWVHGYKLNANFLLAHIGQPYLTDEQYEERGPATWVKDIERRELEIDLEGRFSPPCTSDPVALRVDQVARAMREAGVDEVKILAAARDMLQAELDKLTRQRGGYTCAEPTAGMPRAAEHPACYPDPKKAAGDDTV